MHVCLCVSAEGKVGVYAKKMEPWNCSWPFWISLLSKHTVNIFKTEPCDREFINHLWQLLPPVKRYSNKNQEMKLLKYNKVLLNLNRLKLNSFEWKKSLIINYNFEAIFPSWRIFSSLIQYNVLSPTTLNIANMAFVSSEHLKKILFKILTNISDCNSLKTNKISDHWFYWIQKWKTSS